MTAIEALVKFLNVADQLRRLDTAIARLRKHVSTAEVSEPRSEGDRKARASLQVKLSKQYYARRMMCVQLNELQRQVNRDRSQLEDAGLLYTESGKLKVNRRRLAAMVQALHDANMQTKRSIEDRPVRLSGVETKPASDAGVGSRSVETNMFGGGLDVF